MLQVAVRINDGNAAARVDVLEDGVFEQTRLADARLPDDQHVVQAVEFGEGDLFFAGMGEGRSQDGSCWIEVKVHKPRSARRSRFPEQGSDVNTQWLA